MEDDLDEMKIYINLSIISPTFSLKINLHRFGEGFPDSLNSGHENHIEPAVDSILHPSLIHQFLHPFLCGTSNRALVRSQVTSGGRITLQGMDTYPTLGSLENH